MKTTLIKMKTTLTILCRGIGIFEAFQVMDGKFCSLFPPGSRVYKSHENILFIEVQGVRHNTQKVFSRSLAHSPHTHKCPQGMNACVVGFNRHTQQLVDSLSTVTTSWWGRHLWVSHNPVSISAILVTVGLFFPLSIKHTLANSINSFVGLSFLGHRAFELSPLLSTKLWMSSSSKASSNRYCKFCSSWLSSILFYNVKRICIRSSHAYLSVIGWRKGKNTTARRHRVKIK